MAQSVVHDYYKGRCPERHWLPRHLLLRVIGKQAAITLPAFGQTCLEASVLVNSVVSGCEAAALLRDTVQRYTWKGILTSEAINEKDDEDNKLFRAKLGNYRFYELEPIHGWVRGFLHWRVERSDLFLADDHLVEWFMKMREELGDRPAPKTPAQRRQWSNVRLIALPDALGKSIVYKMPSQAVFRLRKTCRSSLQLVDSAIESNPLISLAFELIESHPDVKRYLSRRDPLQENSNWIASTFLNEYAERLTVNQTDLIKRARDKQRFQRNRWLCPLPLSMDWDFLGYGRPDFDEQHYILLSKWE